MFTAADATHPDGAQPGAVCCVCEADACQYAACVAVAMRAVDLAFMIGAPRRLYAPFVAAIEPKAQTLAWNAHLAAPSASAASHPGLACMVSAPPTFCWSSTLL